MKPDTASPSPLVAIAAGETGDASAVSETLVRPGEAPMREVVSVRDFLQIFSAVMLPMFLAAVDQTLLATATPSIASDLGGLRDTSWIAVGYLLAATVMVPMYGRLGDRYGRRDVLLVALGVFAAGSITCALAVNMGMLVGARVLQGLGGGGLMVMAQAMIGELVRPRQRARFQGYFGAVFTLASVTGPVLGGFVVSQASWRWLFWINLPLIGLAVWRLMQVPRLSARTAAGPIEDKLGVVLFAAAAVSALLWLSFGGHRFAWLSTPSVFLVAASAALWFVLIQRERRLAEPFLPIELLRERAIALMSLTVICFACCMFALVFFLPIYLQLGRSASAAHSGLLLLPLTFGIVIGSTSTGRITARTGRPTIMPVIGLSLSSAMLLLLGLVQPSPSVVGVVNLLIGLGFGSVMPTAQIVIQTIAGRARLGAAAATVSLARSVGSALGTALFGSLVFGLLGGVDLNATLHGGTPEATEAVISAFHIAFICAAGVAAAGALIASRLPQVKI